MLRPAKDKKEMKEMLAWPCKVPSPPPGFIETIQQDIITLCFFDEVTITR